MKYVTGMIFTDTKEKKNKPKKHNFTIKRPTCLCASSQTLSETVALQAADSPRAAEQSNVVIFTKNNLTVVLKITCVGTGTMLHYFMDHTAHLFRLQSY